MTLEEFKNGISCVPLSFLNTVAEDLGIEQSRHMMFRDYTDIIATELWYNHMRRKLLVIQIWPHCFNIKSNR